MRWAIKENLKISPTPKDRATCPICNQEVIAKCGEINIWHWAHKSDLDCDSFGEPESEWHSNWKKYFPVEFQEVIVMFWDGIKHRADIRNREGLVIELQNSPLSSAKIKEREEFYENMVWILNGETLAKNIIYFRRRFKWNNRTWQTANKRIYIDEGGDTLISLDFESGTFTRCSKIAFIIMNGGKNWIENGRQQTLY